METFGGVLRANARGGCTVELPFDAKSVFGSARAPVVATVNGHAFRTTLMRYGAVDYLGVNGTVREAAGAKAGDRISVTLERDPEPRRVEPPPELSAVLAADPVAREAFEGLSFTHRREYAEWVGRAKRAETRSRRATRAAAMLADGVRRP